MKARAPTMFERGKRAQWNWPHGLAAGLLLLGLGGGEGRAQLAVTEVMSLAAGTTLLNSQADWFELTNFGTNTLDLTGWLYCDGDKVYPVDAISLPFEGLIMGPGESVIFVRADSNTTDADHFRAIWGITTNVQVRFYPKPFGFNELKDAVQIGNPSLGIAERVDFREARQGITFAYDRQTGRFGTFSLIGNCGEPVAAYGEVLQANRAWRARMVNGVGSTNDIGSPGVACGPVPLVITIQPTNQTVDAGMEVTFTVRADGLPRPAYQWYFNGAPLPDSNTADYRIAVTKAADAGEYLVVLTNGLERLASATMVLGIDLTSRPPSLTGPPQDLAVTFGQTATFCVAFRGYPLPQCQWSLNGVDLPEATNRCLTIYNAQATNAGTYSVRIWNDLGSTNANASLAVTRKPRLMITEVMSLACTNDPAVNPPDWWELTHLDTNTVDLFGWKWDDWPGTIGGGPTITNHILIRPGESVIFAEAMDRQTFIAMWGPSNLPPDLQVITYAQNRFITPGDEVWLWNASATDKFDFINRVVFSTATPGASFWFNTDSPCAEYGKVSSVGEGGAFRAAADCSVGSPGWTPWTPPYWTSITSNALGLTLAWRAAPGATNLVQYKRTLADANWIPLGSVWAGGAARTFTDATLGADLHRYYRIVNLPNCHCYDIDFGDWTATEPVASEIWAWPSPGLTIRPVTGAALLGWQAPPGTIINLQCTTNLGAFYWTTLTNFPTGSSSGSLVVTNTDPMRFYRLSGRVE